MHNGSVAAQLGSTLKSQQHSGFGSSVQSTRVGSQQQVGSSFKQTASVVAVVSVDPPVVPTVGGVGMSANF